MSDLTNNDSCGTSCGCADSTPQTYWQDVENKVLDPAVLKAEFPEGEYEAMSSMKNRRSFLKIMGFSVSALPLTGCVKIPVKKALPYLNKQPDTIPGVANWYASTYKDMPILVKTREGRPIKVEGNALSQTTFGGANAQAQASVMSLYDSSRLREPKVASKSVEWEEFDSQLKQHLENSEGEVVLVTPAISSKSELAIIEKFSKKYQAKHIAYEPVSKSALYQANKITHGAYTGAEYNFENADVVVSLGADFLSTFGNGVANTKGYSKRRDAKTAKMSKHIQVEEVMSLTGSNADHRFTRSVADQHDILLGVLAGISSTTHNTKAENKDIVKIIVSELSKANGRSLVLAGENDVNVQVVVNKINTELGNYGRTISVRSTSFEKLENDNEFESFVNDLSEKTSTVIFVNTNPVYNYYNSEKLTAGLKKVKAVVSLTLSENETSNIAHYVAPINHTYESWSDTLVSKSELSITQPTIQPLYGTRMYVETLMSLMGDNTSFYDFMKSTYTGSTSWNKFLHDGVMQSASLSRVESPRSFNIANYIKNIDTKSSSNLTLSLYVKDGIGNGDFGDNPWIQEMPNPITKATWGNYFMVSPVWAKENSVKSGDILEAKIGGTTIKTVALVQPGTDKNTVGLAVGYGRTIAGKTAKGLGVNAYPFMSASNGSFTYNSSTIELKKTGKTGILAQTQTHHSMEGRDIVREATYEEYMQNPKAGNTKKAKLFHIYPEHKKDGHQWAMAINLSTCTGCSSCIVSCNAENNIPVVGKEEVNNRREMHWLRLDRYYKGDESNPEVVHMPMLCQHCDNAPCENVCPVMATLQSSDGLNQQVYNRCVGTRYCANNCPYKVRRFNWFNYDRGSETERMVLNPDISTRTRGIMEKCSMCIQRIQDGKLSAKRDRKPLKDGAIQTACQQSCPSDAIIFGDKNDPNSKISKYLAEERKYVVLEDLNVQPRVNYLTKIRNK